MKLRKLWSIRKTQKGFTIIEIMFVLAITGLISAGAAMSTAQIVTQGARNSEYAAANQHTLNAVHWISRDAQMSQTVVPNGATGFPLDLKRVGWENSVYEASYNVTDGKLIRSYSINGTLLNEMLVAEYINMVSENTTVAYSDNVVALKVTATMGSGSNAASVTKEREIKPRPSL